jgi:SAM-dependent methyltransferase
MERNRQYLRGRVLDFGAGKQPYRDLVDGEYIPLEKGDTIPALEATFDCVMCNQVIQYLRHPGSVLDQFHDWLVLGGGHLVMTYPSNWDEIEADDLWRFTKMGMELMLKRASFEVMVHDRRAEIDLNGFKFPLGYGVVARAS